MSANLAYSPALPARREPIPAAPPAHQGTSSTPITIPARPFPPTHPIVEKIAEPAAMPVEALSVSTALQDLCSPMDIASFVLKPAASAP